jgi:hypothetical protein
MIQKDFANKVVEIIKHDELVIGLAAAGSWITEELDEYSDLDLVLITKEKIAPDKAKMTQYANRFGDLLSAFTGEHVGEPRLLICMYDDPLLHVDIKFLTLAEFKVRIENPVVLFERNKKLSDVISSTKAEWPQPDFQWIEDRFWTWVHYTAAKIGRGEYFDALNAIEYMRMHVLSPLMQEKNKKQMRGLRKVETQLNAADLENLKITVAQYNRASLIKALDNEVSVYRSLRRRLYTEKVALQERTEKRSMEYFKKIKNR